MSLLSMSSSRCCSSLASTSWTTSCTTLSGRWASQVSSGWWRGDSWVNTSSLLGDRGDFRGLAGASLVTLSISCSISSSLSRLLQLVSRRLETSLLVTRYREGGCRCWGILLLLLLCSNLLTFSPHQQVWFCV